MTRNSDQHHMHTLGVLAVKYNTPACHPPVLAFWPWGFENFRISGDNIQKNVIVAGEKVGCWGVFSAHYYYKQSAPSVHRVFTVFQFRRLHKHWIVPSWCISNLYFKGLFNRNHCPRQLIFSSLSLALVLPGYIFNFCLERFVCLINQGNHDN